MYKPSAPPLKYLKPVIKFRSFNKIKIIDDNIALKKIIYSLLSNFLNLKK